MLIDYFSFIFDIFTLASFSPTFAFDRIARYAAHFILFLTHRHSSNFQLYFILSLFPIVAKLLNSRTSNELSILFFSLVRFCLFTINISDRFSLLWILVLASAPTHSIAPSILNSNTECLFNIFSFIVFCVCALLLVCISLLFALFSPSLSCISPPFFTNIPSLID